MNKLLRVAAVLSVSAFACLLVGQPAGTVTVSPKGIVTANCDLLQPPMRCTFEHAYDAVLVQCYVSNVINLWEVVEPAIGSKTGAQAAFIRPPNAVTWTLKQPTEDVFTWVIAADGTAAQGTFF